MSDQRRPGEYIAKSELRQQSVVLWLENGVQINISSNDGYLHVSMSGVDTITVEEPRPPNYINLNYKIREGLKRYDGY